VTVETWLVVAFFALVVGLVTAAGYWVVLRPSGAAGRGESPALSEALLVSRPAWAGILGMLGEALPAAGKSSPVVKKRLTAAGYRHPSAVSVYSGLQWAAVIVLGLAGGLATYLTRGAAGSAVVAALAAAGCGHLIAERVLDWLISARRDRLRRALPDALDLMVLCLEAGQALDQAVLDSTLELKRSYPDLAAELTLVHLELRAGKSRGEALRNLADRNREPELRKLVNVLVQSDRFGTSMGPALRTHARYLRVRRKQKAEESARKVGVKLIFPIFFLIFPSLLLVTLGPAVLQIFTQLLPMIAGQ